jgi:hypothetical protein
MLSLSTAKQMIAAVLGCKSGGMVVNHTAAPQISSQKIA